MPGRPLARTIDRFAEMLAQTEGTERDGDLAWVAHRLGLSRADGQAMFRRILVEVGWVG